MHQSVACHELVSPRRSPEVICAGIFVYDVSFTLPGRAHARSPDFADDMNNQ
jgi:hypothetical protein